MSTSSRNGTFPLDPADVLRTVADAYHLDVAHLKSQGRRQPAVAARLVAYVLLHDECHLGWALVAQTMGRNYGSGGSVAVTARNANPDAVAELRARLRP